MNGSLKRLHLLSLLLFGGLFYGCLETSVGPLTPNNENEVSTDSAQVIIYGRTTCQPCDTLISALDENDISFQFRNIENPALRDEMWRKLSEAKVDGGVMIPVVEVGEALLIQPDLREITRHLQSSRAK